MYAKCGSADGPTGPVDVPCYEEHEPLLVNSTALDASVIAAFESLCPTLRLDQPMCCDHTQIEQLISNVNILRSLVYKCPVCLHNLMTYICSMTCHPQQATFLNITGWEEATDPPAPNKKKVMTAVISMDAIYRDTIYNSCANIKGDTGPAITMLCGFQEDCDPRKLFEAMGAEGTSPFVLTQKYSDDPEADPKAKYFNTTVYNCSEHLTKEVWPLNPSSCLCLDCDAACFHPVFPSWSDNTTQLTVLDFTLLGIFVLSTFLTVAYLIFVREKNGRRVAAEEGDTQAQITNFAESSSARGDEKGETSEIIEESQFTVYQSLLFRWTLITTTYPKTVIFTALFVIILLSLGLLKLDMQEDPVELWSSPNARSRQEKNFFDNNFGPFYRVQQVIVTLEKDQPFVYKGVNYSGIYTLTFMKNMLQLQNALRNVSGEKTGTKLEDLCFAPMDGKCLFQSPLNFIQANETVLNKVSFPSIIEHISKCLENPINPDDGNKWSCLGEWGGPGLREVVLGGYDDVGNFTPTWHRYTQATSFVITMLLRDSVNETYRKNAEDFEQAWLAKLHSLSRENTTLALPNGGELTYRMTYFSGGRSVADEIARQSESDVLTITISYICMFLYISLTLGSFYSLRRIFIDSKVSLGLAGVLIVLACVVTSIGALAPFIQFNLIIIEVIPFLILAVGVDNMFLMVMSMQRKWMSQLEKNESDVPRVLATIMATDVGPSILISALSESGCFFIGFLVSTMPAVRVFALTASLSLVILLLLQMTLFLALLYLDSLRYARNSPDTIVVPLHFIFFGASSDAQNEDAQTLTDQSSSSSFYVFITDRILGNFCTKKYCRSLVVLLWMATLFLCIRQIPRTEIGLDQEDSVPRDSYVLNYMKDQKEILRVGAPLYFVVDSSNLKFNYTQTACQNAICGTGNGSSYDRSLGNIINVWSQEGPFKDNINTKYIRSHATSWLDSMLNTWYHDSDCCMVLEQNETLEFCDYNSPNRSNCESCKDKILPDQLVGETFKTLIKGFLKQKPGPPPGLCPFGGLAQFAYTINFTDEFDIRASYYSTYHLPAKSSGDMINSLITARRVSSEIEDYLKQTEESVKVFPYSIFYVFYEQYLTSWKDAAIGILTSTLAVVFVVSLSRVLGHMINHIIFIATLVSFSVHVFGLMSYFGVSLNALTIVNQIMSVGISVEFTTHLLMAFVSAGPGDREKRARHAMKFTGSSVLAGITLTKLIGIMILAFATSQIFTIYYFRFYLVLVIVGAYHGLIILPALLSIMGQ